MRIRRRDNAGRSWLVDLAVDGRRYRKTLPGTLGRREVEAWGREWRRRLETPGAARHAAATVGDILERYWQEHGCRLADRRKVQGYLGMMGTALGVDTPAQRVDASHISAIIARWRGTVADITINRRLAPFRAAWTWAEEVLGMPLPRIPWRRLHLAEPLPQDRSLSHEARARLLSCWPERTRVVAELALATGLRRCAILRLTSADIDRARRVVRTIGKGVGGGKENLVPITSAVAAILDRLELPQVGRIFTVTVDQLRDDRVMARKAAGLPGFKFHDFRHTFAQILEDAGLGDTIAAALHHTSPMMRRRYAHARLEQTREAIEEAWRRQRSCSLVSEGQANSERMRRVDWKSK